MLHMRIAVWVLVGALAAAGLPFAACSKKEIRYPADHLRYQNIDAAVESLRKAYAEKDRSTLHKLILPVAALDRTGVDIERDFEQFEEITLDLSIERIVIEGDTIHVFVHWQGNWKRRPEDPGIRERGHGVLRWVGMQSIMLRGIEGDLFFGMSTRHPEGEGTPAGKGT
jgi:hypothetical protein